MTAASRSDAARANGLCQYWRYMVFAVALLLGQHFSVPSLIVNKQQSNIKNGDPYLKSFVGHVRVNP